MWVIQKDRSTALMIQLETRLAETTACDSKKAKHWEKQTGADSNSDPGSASLRAPYLMMDGMLECRMVATIRSERYLTGYQFSRLDWTHQLC